MRIIYGGSFDPTHRGHLELMKIAMDCYPQAELIVSPVVNHAFGKDSKPFEIRAMILNNSVSRFFSIDYLRKITIIPCEKYMIDFLGSYKIKFNKLEDMILIGSDIIPELNKWKGFSNHLKDCKYLISPRENEIPVGIAKLKYYKLLRPIGGISSTQIREILKDGRQPLKVAEIIDFENIFKYYGANNDN